MPSRPRLVDLSIRTRRLGVLAVTPACMLALSVFALDAIRQQRAATAQVATMATLTHQIDCYNADMSGWLAWDADFMGRPAAVKPDAIDRKGFLTGKVELTAALAAFDTAAMTADERTAFAAMTAEWEEFFTLDEKIVAIYQQGTPDSIANARQAIQTDTGDAVGAITEITEIIDRLGSYQTTIAGAVEEQTATTGEMSRSVADAAGSAGEIAAAVSAVAQTSRGTIGSADEVRTAAQEVARIGTDLTTAVARFRL